MGNKPGKLAVLLLVISMMVLSSCGKKEMDSPEAKQVKKRWEEFRKVVKKQDLEKFKSMFAKEHRDFLNFENYMKRSIKAAGPGYDIVEMEFNEKKTKATVKFKNRLKKDFIKEDGVWVLKEL